MWPKKCLSIYLTVILLIETITFIQAPVAKKVKQLENLTSNSSRLGSTEVIASVSVLITATKEVSGNFTVRPLL